MPTAPPRACKCGALVTDGRTCSTCKREREQRRGTAHQRGYDKRWARYARDFRARFPFCGQRVDGRFYSEHSLCTREGVKRLGDVVDHITPIRDGGPVFDPSNHQTLCARCNVIKG